MCTFSVMICVVSWLFGDVGSIVAGLCSSHEALLFTLPLLLPCNFVIHDISGDGFRCQ